MRIIKIAANEGGGHANQVIEALSGSDFKTPVGWALVPEDLLIPDTFPYVQIEVENGAVTRMTASEVPNIETPAPEPDPDDDRDAMIIDLDYRVTLLELGLAAEE